MLGWYYCAHCIDEGSERKEMLGLPNEWQRLSFTLLSDRLRNLHWVRDWNPSWKMKKLRLRKVTRQDPGVQDAVLPVPVWVGSPGPPC